MVEEALPYMFPDDHEATAKLKMQADYSLSTSQLLDKVMNHQEAFYYTNRRPELWDTEFCTALKKALHLDHKEQHFSSLEVHHVAIPPSEDDFDWENFITHEAA